MSVERRMNRVLERLGLPFKVVWTPDPTHNSHGNIDLAQRVIHIYNETEQGAWCTLLHEVLELRLRKITSLYQGLVNALIEYIERHVFYPEKESFLNSLPSIIKTVEKERNRNE